MTASAFMASMVDFECGQKGRRLALFQDDPGELGGAHHHERRLRGEFARNSSNNPGASRRDLRCRMMTRLWRFWRPVLIPVRLDIQQREGAEHAWLVGRRGLVQVRVR